MTYFHIPLKNIILKDSPQDFNAKSTENILF